MALRGRRELPDLDDLRCFDWVDADGSALGVSSLLL